jgi:hypothetical protein
MRRNYKEEKPEQIELSSYLSRRSITFEDIVKKRNFKSVADVTKFFSNIGVVAPNEKIIKKVLQKLKKSKLSAHSQQDPIVINKHQQRTSRKKTRSKKLTNIVESTDETKSSETVLNTLDTIISETPSNTEQGNA